MLPVVDKKEKEMLLMERKYKEKIESTLFSLAVEILFNK